MIFFSFSVFPEPTHSVTHTVTKHSLCGYIISIKPTTSEGWSSIEVTAQLSCLSIFYSTNADQCLIEYFQNNFRQAVCTSYHSLYNLSHIYLDWKYLNLNTTQIVEQGRTLRLWNYIYLYTIQLAKQGRKLGLWKIHSFSHFSDCRTRAE